jgi:hypothetical protein
MQPSWRCHVHHPASRIHQSWDQTRKSYRNLLPDEASRQISTCVLRCPPSVSFVAQPTNRSLFDFDAQTKKLSRWFWDPNHQTGAVSFEVQTRKPEPPVLRPNRRKPSPPVLRLNWRKPSKWFWSQTTHKPSILVLRLNQKIHARRLHVHGADRTQHHPTIEYPTCVTIIGPLH